jgi:short-subunit dehydrogenase
MADQPDTTDNLVAVITGASSGIGQATAYEFAKNGYDVVLVARRQKLLKQVAEECEKFGVRAVHVTADTAIENDVQKIADTALVTFGRVDVWVNGAAVSLYAKFEETPMEDFRRLIDTNLFGYVNGARVAITQFKEQGYGVLINITSVNAATPQPYNSAYVASKYALRGLSDSVRMELELEGFGDKIHVCNAMPASVDTNLFQNAANYTNREIQALEPVYDPAYVAKQIVKLAKRPKREIIIGPAGKMMAFEHYAMPNLYEKLVSKFIARNHISKHLTEDTTGNLYEPVQDNTGMYGGWREKRLRADKLNKTIGTVAAITLAAVAAGYALSRKSRAHKPH